jgi:hypothetical protein
VIVHAEVNNADAWTHRDILRGLPSSIARSRDYKEWKRRLAVEEGLVAQWEYRFAVFAAHATTHGELSIQHLATNILTF